MHYVGLPWYARERSPMGRPDVVQRYCGDADQTVICYPRTCDSLAFYLCRDDLHNVRSKHAAKLVEDLQSRPRTVVLFTHRHSLEALGQALPKELKLTPIADLRRQRHGPTAQLVGEVPWGLCDIAVVERVN